MSVRVTALDHLVINVSDVARSAEWYRKVLGMEIMVFEPGNGKPPRTSLNFGNQKINVRPRDADRSSGSPRTMKPPAATICAFSPRRRRSG
jgi:catechol 2,3-dioxygenase-like lactoylglutathione lyase family enzyme